MSLTSKELLSSLPISVLRDGKIIKIREEIEELLEPSSTKVNIIHVDTPDAGKDGANLTTIHVRSSDGEHTLVLKMKYNDTIGQLKSFITNFRTKQDKFQLICPFPTKKILTVDTQSLEEAQLIPNATLYIRSI
jgi:hypothetical protein